MHFALRLQAGLSDSACAVNQKRSAQKLEIKSYYFKLSDGIERTASERRPLAEPCRDAGYAVQNRGIQKRSIMQDISRHFLKQYPVFICRANFSFVVTITAYTSIDMLLIAR
jgi:hypothetical protein